MAGDGVAARFGVALRDPMAHHVSVSRPARLLLLLTLSACGADESGHGDATEPPPVKRLDVGTSPTSPVVAVEADDVPAIAPTDLPLVLMATMVSDDPARSRATVRDEERSSITTYAIGDLVRPGVTITEVQNDAVVLRNGEDDERLDFPEEPVALSGREVFYPDFVDFDARTNSMDDAVQLQPGPGYAVKREAHAWGTPRTVAAIQAAVKRYLDRGLGGPDVHVGDISLRTGGPFPPHLSHQDGRDVDVGYVLQGESADVVRFVTATRGRLDVVRSWALIDAFLGTERVRYIFVDYGLQRILYDYAKQQGVTGEQLDALFQYPNGSAASRGVIRHWRGHSNHFHVRFER